MAAVTGALSRKWGAVAITLAVAAGAAAASLTQNAWLLAVGQDAVSPPSPDPCSRDHHHEHSGHGSEHAHHEAPDVIRLSPSARENIGLKTGRLELSTFEKTVAVPAVVVERPGQSQLQISAPLTGRVTRIYRIEGEAVRPGQPLFELRLTHEDLVDAQREFLQASVELVSNQQQIATLEEIGRDIIRGQRIRDLKYDQQKNEAALKAYRQSLLLHGLTQEQIDQILSTRELIQTYTVKAPPFAEPVQHARPDHLYHVQQIQVKRGQHVQAGDSLGMLANHGLLYVEGRAFEEDAQRLLRAARGGWPIAVQRVSGDGHPTEHLKISRIADRVGRDSRVLRFYLPLPNQPVRDVQVNGRRLLDWKYRPGQRMQVRLPVGQRWKNQLVLPPEAIAQDGAEAYVFEQNEDSFQRVPVHVLYQDEQAVVIENDPLLLSAVVALSGAYQLQLELKNRTGGAVDPHAGHHH